jgi:hypothetical protein
MKTKTRSAVLLIVVYALIVLLGFFVINGFDVGIYDVRPSRHPAGLDITVESILCTRPTIRQ